MTMESLDRRAPPGSAGVKSDQAWLRTADDDALLAHAREGHVEALAELYGRHRRDALRYARGITRRHLGHDASDDVVAEAVRKVLTALGRGRGPRTGFRAYLFTAIRTVTLTESLNSNSYTDHGGLREPEPPETDEPGEEHIVLRALSRLPERWRRVLWTTRVEQLAPAAAGSLLGMRPNSVAALAMRAREALRIAYVREHLPQARDRACRTALDLLARRAVVTIAPARDAFLRNHLGSCDRCEDAVELLDAKIGNWIRSADWASVTDIFRRHDRSSAGDGGIDIQQST